MLSGLRCKPELAYLYSMTPVAVMSGLLYNHDPTQPVFTPMLKPELQTVVERLCEDGCRAVSRYILEIETGQMPDSMQGLNLSDRETILAELKSIMAVYEQR